MESECHGRTFRKPLGGHITPMVPGAGVEPACHDRVFKSDLSTGARIMENLTPRL